MNIMDNLLLGLNVTVIGMIVTFVGLVSLICLIYLNKKVIDIFEKKTEDKKPIEVKKEAPKTIQPKSVVVIDNAAKAGDQNEIMGVISAAIACIFDGENKQYRIKSIKPTPTVNTNVNNWNLVQVQEQNNTF